MIDNVWVNFFFQLCAGFGLWTNFDYINNVISKKQKMRLCSSFAEWAWGNNHLQIPITCCSHGSTPLSIWLPSLFPSPHTSLLPFSFYSLLHSLILCHHSSFYKHQYYTYSLHFSFTIFLALIFFKLND